MLKHEKVERVEEVAHYHCDDCDRFVCEYLDISKFDQCRLCGKVLCCDCIERIHQYKYINNNNKVPYFCSDCIDVGKVYIKTILENEKAWFLDRLIHINLNKINRIYFRYEYEENNFMVFYLHRNSNHNPTLRNLRWKNIDKEILLIEGYPHPVDGERIYEIPISDVVEFSL